MKRIIAVLLLITLSFSLLACAAPTPAVAPAPAEAVEEGPSEKEMLFDKYEDIIKALEAEDYDKVINAVTAMKPVPTPPAATKVDITLDNYLEYFDLITDIDDTVKDAHGNPTQLDRYTYLKLKDMYSIDSDNPGEIIVGIEYDESVSLYKGTDIDRETFTASGKRKALDNFHESIQNSSYVSRYDNTRLYCSLFQETIMIGDKETNTWLVSNFEIVNISGTIYLLNN